MVLLLVIPLTCFGSGGNISDRVAVGQTQEQITQELGRPF